MEIKEGMYIIFNNRLLLGKVKKIEENEFLIITGDCFGSRDGDNWYTLYELDKSKSSYDITDLIESGDMVNGQIIQGIKECGLKLLPKYDENNKIKTILTYEQIKQYEYTIV